MDESTKRLLVKKIWCHGQAIAPFQGFACGYWAVAEPESPLPQRMLLFLAAIVLPIWAVVSWRAVHGRSLNYWKIICYFGLFIEVVHTSCCYCCCSTRSQGVVAFADLHLLSPAHRRNSGLPYGNYIPARFLYFGHGCAKRLAMG